MWEGEGGEGVLEDEDHPSVGSDPKFPLESGLDMLIFWGSG
jgi:hypothetical protein